MLSMKWKNMERKIALRCPNCDDYSGLEIIGPDEIYQRKFKCLKCDVIIEGEWLHFYIYDDCKCGRATPNNSKKEDLITKPS